MNQVPTPAQTAACLEHLAVLDKNHQNFLRQTLGTTHTFDERGFSVVSGIVNAGAPDAGVAIRIRGQLPIILERFLQDMRDDTFISRIDPSISLNRTLVRYQIPDAAQFGDIVLRQIRTKRISVLAPRGCEHISLYAMQITKNAAQEVERIEIRSHSITPKDTIQLFLQATDRVLHDTDHFDQLRDIFSTIILTKNAGAVRRGNTCRTLASAYSFPPSTKGESR
jgi:hypothetical protein